MENMQEIKTAEEPASAGVGRSTVDFPYTDLDSAIDVVRGVHSAGGTSCENDQLAAELKLEAKGGGFRLRLNGAKTFALISYERGGRISLTELGQQIIDPLTERNARVQAFLSVKLYTKVWDQFKGGPLPPQAGLDRALVSLGVGSGVKEKARQVLMRSAKQAGFLEYATDRLVKPSIKTDLSNSVSTSQDKESEGDGRKTNQPSAGSDHGSEHPLIKGLLITLPKPGEEWAFQDRFNWLTMANSIFKMVYKCTDNNSSVEVSLK